MPTNSLLTLLGIDLPIIQAPMAGVSTAALAAAVSNAGGLGSLGLGSSSVEQAREQIRLLKTATDKPFNVNFFCHQPAQVDHQQEQQWLERLRPYFSEFSVEPPQHIAADYESFLLQPAMLEMLLEERPPVVSFHFGLPEQGVIDALKQAGIRLLGCATQLAEAQAIEAAGLDAIIAQGYEAGGHRGVFNPETDLQLGLLALLAQLTKHCSLPLIAAGGIMNGQAIATVQRMGASAAQLGTAFVACPESSANAAYRAVLCSEQAARTGVTQVISGRPARGIINRMHTEIAQYSEELPAYPIAYSAAKALYAAAQRHNNNGFAPFWAGQAASLIRVMPAAELVATLSAECAAFE